MKHNHETFILRQPLLGLQPMISRAPAILLQIMGIGFFGITAVGMVALYEENPRGAIFISVIIAAFLLLLIVKLGENILNTSRRVDLWTALMFLFGLLGIVFSIAGGFFMNSAQERGVIGYKEAAILFIGGIIFIVRALKRNFFAKPNDSGDQSLKGA